MSDRKPEELPTKNDGRLCLTKTNGASHFLIEEGDRLLGFGYDDLSRECINEHIKSKMNPKFSIIMPSFLGEYRGAARDRDKKIHRAIQSCLDQIYSDFELIIVADGCEKTYEEVEKNYSDPRISCSLIAKQKLWCGGVRNRGIANAKGEYITYLDIDDKLGKMHLGIINMELGKSKSPDWVYFNDHIFKHEEFQERDCNINRKGHNGTSNLCHKTELNIFWRGDDYAHDWHFINDLARASNKFVKIATPQYFVCHIPGVYDV